MFRIISYLRYFLFGVLALLISACDSGGGGSPIGAQGGASTFKLPSALEALATSRQVDRDALFAEVILRYDDVEETVIAARSVDSDIWQANFRLAGGHDYTIELTWFDTVDGARLDLVRFNRSFSAVFESGPIAFEFDDYDFDGFDADSDGFVNLAERQAGTSPLVAEDTNVAVQLCIGGLVIPADAVCAEDAAPALDLVMSELSLNAMLNGSASNNMLINNSGTATLNYTAQANQPWLQLVDDVDGSGVSGAIAPGQGDALALLASCSDSPSVRNGSISVDSDGGSDILLVTLDCSGPILDVTPEFYQFEAQIVAGVGQADTRTMTLSNAGNQTLDFTINSDSSWLCPVNPQGNQCEPAGFSARLAPGVSTQISIEGVCVNSPQMLAGSLMVDSNGGTVIFPATMDCTLAPAPELSLMPSQFDFSAMQNQSSVASLTIANPGTAALEYTLSSTVGWLQIDDTQGVLEAGGSAALQLQAQCGEAVEVLTGELSVLSNATNAAVPVTLECTALPAPMLLLQTAAVSLATELSLGVSGVFEIANTGSANLDYSVSSNRDWLQVTAPQGTLVAGDQIELAIQAGCGTSVEQRSGTITIDSNAGAAQLPVTLDCSAPPQPALELQNTQLSLTAQQNESVTSTIGFSNSGNARLDYSLSSDSDWLQLQGAGGSLAAGSNAALPIQASCDDQVQTRNGTISVASNGGNVAIAVSLVCTAIPQAELSVSTNEIALSAEQNQQTASSLSIANTGNAELQFSVGSDSSWLEILSPLAAVGVGDSTTVAFAASCSDVVEQRLGTLSVTGNGGGATIPVSLTCNPVPAPELDLPVSSLMFAALQNETVAGNLLIRNLGTAPLNYRAESDSSWLQVMMDQGTLAAGADAQLSVAASCDGLVETRVGNVSIDSDGGLAAVQVTLECSALPVAMLSVQTDSLAVQAPQGGSALADISFANTGTAALNYTLDSSASWLQLSVLQGALAVSDTAVLAVTASCDTEELSRSGTININSDGGSAVIPVSIACSPPALPLLAVSVQALTLQAMQEDITTTDFAISNVGNAELDYSASTESSWLELLNASGSIDAGDSTSLVLNAQCDEAVELRSGDISIDSNGGSALISVSLDCTVSPMPVLDVRTTELALEADIGQSVDGTVEIQNSGTAQLSYTISTVGDWLTVVDANTDTIQTLVAGEDRELSVLAECDDEVEVLEGVISFDSAVGTADVPVTLTCLALPLPVLSVETESLALQAVQGGSTLADISFSNTGDTELSYTLSSSASWLQLTQLQGSLDDGDTAVIEVAASCDDEDTTRSATISIDSDGGSADIPVSLMCIPPAEAVLAVSVQALVLQAVQSELASAEFDISNPGNAVLEYTASSDSSWLVLLSDSGSVDEDESDTLELSAQCSSEIELRSGTILIESNGGMISIPVSLDCTALPAPMLVVQPDELTLVADVGESVDASIELQNTGTAPLSYTLAIDGDWLQVDDADSDDAVDLIAGASRELAVVASCSSDAEVLTGSVTISSTAGDAVVAVSLNCSAAILRVEPASLTLVAGIDTVIGRLALDTLAIFNDGDVALDFTITSDSVWLCPDDAGSASCASDAPSFSATVPPADFFSLPVVAECSDVEETLNGAFTIDSNGGEVSVPVTLDCVPAAVPVLQLNPTEFSETLSQNSVGSVALTIENSGTAPLSYEIGSSAPWLAIPLNTGELAAGESTVVEIEYSCESGPSAQGALLSVSWDLGNEVLPFSVSCLGPSSDDIVSSIAGSVLDASDSMVLSGVQVDAIQGDADLAQAFSDENGSFQLNGLPVQQGYSINLSLPGYIAETYFAIDTTEDDTTLLQTVLLVAEQFVGDGMISGTIVDAVNGLGAGNLVLEFRRGINNRTDSTITATAMTDGNGLYSIDEIPAGNYTVQVSGVNYEDTFFNAISFGGQENSAQDTLVSPVNPVVDGIEFINVANGAVSEPSEQPDTALLAVIQTVPVLNDGLPSSVDTPITLFFNDKLILESLFGNMTVLHNDEQVGGTATITESASGFAIITFVPNERYDQGATVSLTLRGGVDGVLGDAGNLLAGNIGEDFQIAFTTIDENVQTFDNNLSFENSEDGVIFSGDGAVVSEPLGCLLATDGTRFAAITTGTNIVSGNAADGDTSSAMQLGPITLNSNQDTVSFDYNFISDEFNEFVGSEFDDSAVISVSGPDGSSAMVLTTVNMVGVGGNTQCTGINGFNDASYIGHTGWINETIDVSGLGSPVMITFTVTDVGDTGVSSLLTIDNVQF